MHPGITKLLINRAHFSIINNWIWVNLEVGIQHRQSRTGNSCDQVAAQVFVQVNMVFTWLKGKVG